MDPKGPDNENSASRLYVGNLDFRISESDVIKLFSPYGKIIAEDFLLHTRGPKRGEPRGYAFVQYTTKEEAQLAKEKMNGKLVRGRPVVVHLASEKCFLDSSNPQRALKDKKLAGGSGSKSAQTDRAAKISAIKNKLKSLENEGCSTKRPRLERNDLKSTSEQSDKKQSDKKL